MKKHLIPRARIFALFFMLSCAFMRNASPLPAEPAARNLPKFQLKMVDGTVVSGKDLEGKVTIIDFWAVWCRPCIAEIPDYNAFYRQYKSKGVRFLALATDSGTEADVRQTARRFKMEYPVAAPSLKELDLFGELYVLPTTWVVDSKGTVVKEILGVPPNKHQTIRTLVDSLLKDARK